MDRTPICYGYGRHSTAKQEMTRDAQEFRVQDYWERNLAPKGVVWGGFHYDEATSGRQPFTEREHGRVIHAVAQPGDHIVVAKLDRPFRSLRDGIVSMEQWHDRGVLFHSLDLQVDTSTPIGRFFRSVLLAVAELEREFAKERTQEIIQSRRRQGLPYSRGCAIGWKIVGESPFRRYKADPVERAFIDRMAQLRSQGLSTDHIALWCVGKGRDPACKRTFSTRGLVRAALNARKMGYPKVSDYKAINKMASGRA